MRGMVESGSSSPSRCKLLLTRSPSCFPKAIPVSAHHWNHLHSGHGSLPEAEEESHHWLEKPALLQRRGVSSPIAGAHSPSLPPNQDPLARIFRHAALLALRLEKTSQSFRRS